MNSAFIGLGTNIEPRKSHLDQAIKQLENNEKVSIQAMSSVYETAPVGFVDQSDFLNMVIQVNTDLPPTELLAACQKIEQELGRERTIINGPRTIDLDILTYNKENVKTERLTIPHPRMQERAFVLIPFVEIASEKSILIEDKSYCLQELLDKLPENEKKDVLIWSEIN